MIHIFYGGLQEMDLLSLNHPNVTLYFKVLQVAILLFHGKMVKVKGLLLYNAMIWNGRQSLTSIYFFTTTSQISAMFFVAIPVLIKIFVLQGELYVMN